MATGMDGTPKDYLEGYEKIFTQQWDISGELKIHTITIHTCILLMSEALSIGLMKVNIIACPYFWVLLSVKINCNRRMIT